MLHLAKYSLLSIILVFGILVSGAANAAPVVNLHGDYANTNTLLMTGEMGIIEELTSISQTDAFIFSASWNGAAFDSFEFTRDTGEILLSGTMDSFSNVANIFMEGFYTIQSGLLADDFSASIMLDFLFTDSPFLDFYGQRGELEVTLTSNPLPTPVPTSLLILGSGLLAFAGFKRKNHYAPQ